MTHNIQIQVADLGKSVGTLGWLNERLATAKIEIKPSTKGILCAYLTYTQPTTKKTITHAIAECPSSEKQRLEAEEFKGYGYQRYDGTVAYAFASDGEWAQPGESRWSAFKGVRLNNAAKKIVEELIQKAVEQLKNAFNEN